MRLVVQRVQEASVAVGDREVAAIGRGALVLAGFARRDAAAALPTAVDALLRLRLFDDAAGRLSRSLQDVDGELLLVSQVTLVCGWPGGRPSFDPAAPADAARALFEEFVRVARAKHPKTQAGVFQAHMTVRLINDGPVTVILEPEA
jgi:D-tyrosyl-tRNA(Tyr) deacylase